MKYVKRNALAGLSFTSFDALQSHLIAWMHDADRRVHGTTNRLPAELFAEQEADALTPLPLRPCVARTRQLKRRVANDALVHVDTVRYSVPHRLVGEDVFVQVGEDNVVVHHNSERVAVHARCHEPHRRITCAEHYDGLLRKPVDLRAAEHDATGTAKLAEMGRILAQYEAVVQGASR